MNAIAEILAWLSIGAFVLLPVIPFLPVRWLARLFALGPPNFKDDSP